MTTKVKNSLIVLEFLTNILPCKWLSFITIVDTEYESGPINGNVDYCPRSNVATSTFSGAYEGITTTNKLDDDPRISCKLFFHSWLI